MSPRPGDENLKFEKDEIFFFAYIILGLEYMENMGFIPMIPRKNRAFTFVELLSSVAAVALLAAIAVGVTTEISQKTQSLKESNDLQLLNNAVQAYLVSGGDLSRASSVEEVVTLLKLPFSNADRLAGMGGAKLDSQVQLVYYPAGEVQKDKMAIVWSAKEQRFALAEVGDGGGVKGLKMVTTDPERSSEDEGDQEVGVKAKTPFLYAAKDTWIWDFEEAVASPPPGVSEFKVGNTADTTPIPSSTSPMTNGSVSVSVLKVPIFSLPSGVYPIDSFDLPLTLKNPNPADSSEIYYSVNHGNWQKYTGQFSVPMGANVAAQAVASSSLYSNSGRAENAYNVESEQLVAPLISPDHSEFGVYIGHDILVTLLDQNQPSISRIEYRVGGDPWQEYSDPFLLCRGDYPAGTVIQARAVPIVSYYTESKPNLRSLGVEQPVISGIAAGSFSNPILEKGGKVMATNLKRGQSSDVFTWGRDYFLKTETPPKNGGNNLSVNRLTFDGNDFNGVTPGDYFDLGLLSYFNGTTVEGTNAGSVAFTVNLNVELNGVAKNEDFDFRFDLVNVTNEYINPWDDADYVRLASSSSSKILDFNGIEFRLELEFGDSTKTGFSKFNEFYVLENEAASVKLYGKLVEVGSVGFQH